MILVEGRSDRIALETLARRRGLAVPEIVVLDGAHNVARAVAAAPPGVPLVGLCDVKEAPIFRRRLARVEVCDPDLEGELVRALGIARVLEIFEASGELRSFQTLTKQPDLKARPIETQVRRFLAGRAGNKERFGRLFVEALDLARVPAPLDAVLRAG